MMIPKSVKIISLDVGLTLLTPKEHVGKVYSQIAKKYGYHADPQTVQMGFFNTWVLEGKRIHSLGIKEHPQANEERAYQWWKEIFLASLSIPVDEKDQDKIFDECYHHYAKGEVWQTYPEVIDVLSSLRSKGYSLVVLSNWESRLNQTLRELNLTNLFDMIFISTEIGLAKPDPDAFKLILSTLQVEANQVLHVGDSYEADYMAAKQLGIYSYHLNRKDVEFPKPIPYQKGQISSLSELLQEF